MEDQTDDFAPNGSVDRRHYDQSTAARRDYIAYRRDPVPDLQNVEIIRSIDGGPLRTFCGGLAHENGWFASRKSKRLLHWEGVAQLEFVTRAEVEFSVVRVGTESVRFEYVSAAGKQSYTADVELVGSDGTITVVEVKRDERDLGDPDYRSKLHTVSEICRANGMVFKVAFRRDLWESLVHRRNVALFASRGFVTIESAHFRRLEIHARQAEAASTYGRLARALEPYSPRTGEAVIQALTIARRVQIDLTRPLLDETPLTIH